MASTKLQSKIRTTPNLRFKGFNDDWSKQTFGEITKLFSNRNKKLLQAKVYSVTNSNGFVLQTDHFKKVVAGNDLSGYKIIHKNDFAYNPARINVGSIARFNDDIGIISSLYVCFSLNENVSPDFFEYLLEHNRTKHYLDVFGEGGVRVYLWYPLFARIKASVPSLHEQQKITAFLKTVDAWIGGLRKEKELLEDYKRGVVQKIISQEVSFKDKSVENYPTWEEKELGECLSYEQPTKYIVKSTDYDDSFSIPVLTAGKSLILGYTNETDGIFDKGLPVIIFDDFTTSTKFIDFPFKVKSSAMKILRAKKNIDIKFIYEVMQEISYDIGGHGRQWISVFSKKKIKLPSYEEQKAIGNFIAQLNCSINTKNKQIHNAEKWKEGLMQQLFI